MEIKHIYFDLIVAKGIVGILFKTKFLSNVIILN